MNEWKLVLLLLRLLLFYAFMHLQSKKFTLNMFQQQRRERGEVGWGWMQLILILKESSFQWRVVCTHWLFTFYVLFAIYYVGTLLYVCSCDVREWLVATIFMWFFFTSIDVSNGSVVGDGGSPVVVMTVECSGDYLWFLLFFLLLFQQQTNGALLSIFRIRSFFFFFFVRESLWWQPTNYTPTRSSAAFSPLFNSN